MTNKLQVCSDCGQEYEANVVVFVEKPRDLSAGRCLDCRAKRTIQLAREEQAIYDDRLSRTRRKWRRDSGIPKKFMNQKFGTFIQDRPGNVKSVYNKLLAYAKGFPIDYRGYVNRKDKAYPSLIVFSTQVWGIGKSHLAAAICHHILNRWQGETWVRPVHFVSEPELLLNIQATYNYNNEERQCRESESDILNELIARPLLVIDDIGKRRQKDLSFVQRILFAVIDGRYKNLRPVVITTNLNPDELEKYFSGGAKDEAIMDRLVEMTGKSFIEMTGESYRRI